MCIVSVKHIILKFTITPIGLKVFDVLM